MSGGPRTRVRPGPDARMFTSPEGIGVLYLTPVPSQTGDVLLTSGAADPRAVWTPLEIAPAYGHAERHTVIYVDPDDDRRRGLIVCERGRVTLDCRWELTKAPVPAEVLARDIPERRRVVLLAGHPDGWCVLVTAPLHAQGGRGIKVAIIAADGVTRPLEVQYAADEGAPILTDEGTVYLDPPMLGRELLVALPPDRYRAVLRVRTDPALAQP